MLRPWNKPTHGRAPETCDCKDAKTTITEVMHAGAIER